MITWMTHTPDSTLESPSPVNDTAELSAEMVMTGSSTKNDQYKRWG